MITHLGAEHEAEIDLEEDSDDLADVFSSSRVLELMARPEIQRAMAKAMNGELEPGDVLAPNMPRRITQRAMQCALLTVGGYYTLREVSEITGFSYVALTLVMRQPNMRRVLTIANSLALSEMNRIENRMKRKAPRMLKVIQDIIDDDRTPSAVRVKAAFDWLEMSGQGKTVNVKTESTKTENLNITVTSKRSELIAMAISEASKPLALPAPQNEILDYKIPSAQDVKIAARSA